MRTPICDELGIEFPIFAFTHCRDVVVAVSKAGGFGVLGAVGFTPEQLEIELNWIDEHIGDQPYGVDIVIPGKYEGMGGGRPEKLAEMLREMVPQGHLDFARKILADHGVPELPDADSNSLRLLGWTEATATPQVEIALKHDKMRLIANALGTPPPEVIAHIKEAGRKVAALCGSAAPGGQAQGRRRRHHHRPGHRGRRPHRRGRLARAVAQVIEGGGADPGARRPAASAPAARSPPRSPSAPRACGPARCGSPSRRPTCRRPRSSSCSRPRRAATRCGPVPLTGSRAACCATGPRPGRNRAAPTRCPCRCSTWCRATWWPAATSTRRRLST